MQTPLSTRPVDTCPIDFCIELLKGKCKAALLIEIQVKNNRFGQLSRKLNISERMLARQLNELEESGLIARQVFAEVPLRVEYSLTAKGYSILPVVQAMYQWGIANQIAAGTY